MRGSWFKLTSTQAGKDQDPCQFLKLEEFGCLQNVSNFLVAFDCEDRLILPDLLSILHADRNPLLMVQQGEMSVSSTHSTSCPIVLKHD